jgi:dihydroorotase
MPSYDLVLAGGEVIDPASGLFSTADVAVAEGRIAAIGPDLSASAHRRVDCRDSFVTPGLIDGHSHLFESVSKVGARADEAHLRRGVVAAADAGSAGASTFAAFLRLVVEPSQLRVMSFLNVSVLGLIDFRFGELLNPETLVPEDAVAVARAHPDVVKGMKIRLSSDVVGTDTSRCLELLERAVMTAKQAEVPLMVHIGETPATLDEILDRLRPGDVVAHCYTGKEEGILDEEDKLRDCVLQARDRGVVFECAHGKSNFSYAVAERAIEQGFLPDVVCSDTSGRNWNGPVYDLLTTMAKLVSLGMTLDDTVARTTVTPAEFLGLSSEGFGRLEVGGPAHVSVFSQLAKAEEIDDAAGRKRTLRRFEPKLVLVGGELFESIAWRGTVPAVS